MKHLNFIFVALIFLASCATMKGLGDQLAVLNSNSNDYRVMLAKKLKGKSPTEVKEILGIPSNEGLANVHSQDKKNKDFVLLYAAAPNAKEGQTEMRANYNLNKNKGCFIIFFQKKYKYRFDYDALRGFQAWTGNGFCTVYKRYKSSWYDMSAEDFEKKSAYFMN